MQSIRISRQTLNAARLASHYDNYRTAFNKPPYKPEGTNFVPGVGNTTPRIVFVGEAPGENEDRLRVPFCGKAGRLLAQAMADSGLNRARIPWYITNLVKYRPPGNKLSHEVATPAYPMLRTEIQILNPRIVVPLGQWSTAAWFQNFSITQVAGNIYSKRHGDHMIEVMPMLHPSYLLRKNDPKLFQDYVTLFRELTTYVRSSKQQATR